MRAIGHGGARAALALCLLAAGLGAAGAARCSEHGNTFSEPVDGIVARVAAPRPHLGESRLSHGVSAKLSQDLWLHVFDFAVVRYQVASLRGASVTLWGPRGALRALVGHAHRVFGAAFFPEGGRLLTWGEDSYAVVWDTHTGEALRLLHHRGRVDCANVLPGGDRVITCNSHHMCTVWRVATGVALVQMASSYAKDIQVFPSGRHVLLLESGHRASVWDVRTGLRRCVCQAHTQEIMAARVFPDGRKVVTAGHDHRVAIWEAFTCQVLREFWHSTWVSSVVVVGRGEQVASIGTDGEVYIWNATSGSSMCAISGHAHWRMEFCQVMALRAAGDHFVSLSMHGVHLWNAASGRLVRQIVDKSEMTLDAATPPGGNVVVTLNRLNISVWEGGAGAEVHSLAAPADTPFFITAGLARVLDPEGFGPGLPLLEMLRGL